MVLNLQSPLSGSISINQMWSSVSFFFSPLYYLIFFFLVVSRIEHRAFGLSYISSLFHIFKILRQVLVQSLNCQGWNQTLNPRVLASQGVEITGMHYHTWLATIPLLIYTATCIPRSPYMLDRLFSYFGVHTSS